MAVQWKFNNNNGVVSKDLETRVEQLENDTVKITGNQNVAGQKTFTTNNGIIFNPSNGKANYLEWKNGATRIAYIGKASSTDNHFTIEASQGDVKFNVGPGFSINCSNKKITNVANPTATTDVANKQYVDQVAGGNNYVDLTTNQNIGGEKTFTGRTEFQNTIDVNTPSSLNQFLLRFIGDQWTDNQSTDLIRFHKGGAACGYKTYLNGPAFNYAELWGLTLISNMKDPTEDAHGANVRWVKGYSLPKVTTDAVNTIQVTNNSSKYFNFDFVWTGTGYRNWSGINLRVKHDNANFEDMWKVEYRAQNTDGLYMYCVNNKLTFDTDTSLIGIATPTVANGAVPKSYVDALKTQIKEKVAASTDFNDFKTKIAQW